MATLTVRNLDDDVRDRLRVRAAQSGRSMEDEVRVILRNAVTTSDPAAVWALSRKLFSGDDGIELDLTGQRLNRPSPEF